jgi:hypothetical protein
MIIVSHDELKRLEACHGPIVWQMGSWNSDGIFGYTTVPTAAVEKAVGALCSPSIVEALACLQQGPQQTALFLELLGAYPKLVEKIAAAYREDAFPLPKRTGETI